MVQIGGLVLLLAGCVGAQTAPTCSVEQNIDYAGNDLQPVTPLPAANVSECCALCTANPKCFAWSLQPASTCRQAGNCCYLKTSAAGRHSYPNTVSGLNANPPKECSTAFDCSLGGVCNSNGTCICDPTWKGYKCVELNLLPASKVKAWNYANTASWGGNTVYDKSDGKWHLFFAEFLNHCPLGSWGTNSVVSHAIADTPSGPFTKKETVLPPFHHNPTIAYDASTETFLLISIGNGTAGPPPVVPNNCSSATVSAAAAAAEARGSERRGGKKLNRNHNVPAADAVPVSQPLQQPPSLSDPEAAGIITLWTSSSANGPWTLFPRPFLEGRPGKWDAFVTNPSVHIFPNGTILMAYRGGWNPWNVGIAVAASWKDSFERVSDAPVFPELNEDPGIFQDARGNFHILTHYFKGGPGGHAFSPDGRSWTFAGQAYGFTQDFSDGTQIEWARRERPQMLVLDGKPSFLFTGINPVDKGGLSHISVQPVAT